MTDSVLRELAKEEFKKFKIRFREQEIRAQFVRIDIQSAIDIIESKEVIENPIALLINETYYHYLSDTEKKRYVAMLTEKFNRIKRTYLYYKYLHSLE